MAQINLPPFGTSGSKNYIDLPPLPKELQQQPKQVDLTPAQVKPSASGYLDFVRGNVANLLPGTTDALAKLQKNPLSLGGSIQEGIKNVTSSVSNAVNDEAKRISTAITSFTSKGVTPTEKISNVAKAGVGIINAGISPVSALFSAAEQVPILGTVAKLIALPGTIAGESAKLTTDKAIDLIPNNIIHPENKAKIKEAVGEISGLASQFAVYGGAEKASFEGRTGIKAPFLTGITKDSPKLAQAIFKADPTLGSYILDFTKKQEDALISKYGPEDAKTIVTKAAEKARAEVGTPTQQVPSGIESGQTPIDVSKIPPKTKISDIASAAVDRGFPEYKPFTSGTTPDNIVTNASKDVGTPIQPTQSGIVDTVLGKNTQSASPIDNIGKQGIIQQVELGAKPSKMWERVSKDLSLSDVQDIGIRGITLENAFNRAEQIVKEDPAKAYRMANNLENTPPDTTSTMINRVLAEQARVNGDSALQAELTRSRFLVQSRRGQEIVSERTVNGKLSYDDVAKNMSLIRDERIRLLEKKTSKKIPELTKKASEELNSNIKEVSTKDWKSFIDTIECK